MNETEVKKKLGIERWSQMNLEKFRLFLTMSENIDKETHLRIIDQVPNYLSFASTAIKQLNNQAKQNTKIHKSSLKSLEMIISSLTRLADKDKITFEERKFVIEKMMEVSTLIDKIDERHSNILKTIIKWMGGLALGTLAIVAVIFGVKGSNDKS